MTYPTGQPSAGPICPAAQAYSEDALRLGIDPLSGDYLIGDTGQNPNFHTLRLLAVGSLYAVTNCRDSLHKLGYARPDEWSQPIPLAGSSLLRGLTPTDVMRILTKRIPLPRQ